MPYIVPSSAASSPTGTVSPSHSPTRPPLAWSVALASPAPVPPRTPFTPPERPTSPRTATSPTTPSQSLGYAASEIVRHRHSPMQPPPLVKALSDNSAPTTLTTSSPEISKESPVSSRSPPMRRAASASSASPLPSVIRHSNMAGSSLPHIPRRRTGSATSLRVEQTDQSSIQAQSTPPRGRTRSRFVLGSEEESGSGSSAERRYVETSEDKAKEAGENVEERVTRKRAVSAERLSLKNISSSLLPSFSSLVGTSDGAVTDSEGSDCATPTQSGVAKGHRLRGLGITAQINTSNYSEKSSLGIAGTAPRARRGRSRCGAQKVAFGSDSEDEVVRAKSEKSTITFPPSSSPSPPPAIAVNAPTPEMTPYASPQQDSSSKSFAGKRANAGSLRLDFTFGGRPSESNGRKSKNGVQGDHSRTLSESASLNSITLIRKKSGEIVKPSLKTRSSSASSARQRPSLSLGDIASIAVETPSVSAPSTPSTAKMVHFDTQLEHVKIFRSSSRPVAVSRDGSPTYDDTTSGGEGDSASEGPFSENFVCMPRPRRLVPGGTTGEEEEAVRRVLMMRVLNMPHRRLDTDEADVRLEGLHLADDAASVQGIIRVRNIAFEKSVAVRFTFDGWQTTSEVLGRWIESCVPRTVNASPGAPRIRAVSSPISSTEREELSIPTFDRFTFSIRLADLFLRIDEKTLVLAVRYCSGGREMWDNNDGQNYRAVFERRPQHSLSLAAMAVVPGNPDSTRDNARGNEKGRKPGSTGGSSSGATTSDGATYSPSKSSMFTVLDKNNVDMPLSPSKKASDLASRYDLDKSLKNPSSWRPTFDQLRTWAAQGYSRCRTSARGPIPSSEAWNGTGEAADAFTNDSVKPNHFESHNANFKARGIVHGSPRDLDRDTLDDSAVERFSRARFAAAQDATTPDGTPLQRYHGAANRFVSPPPTLAFCDPGGHVRNHHRSYFDSWATTGVSTSSFGTGRARLTPPGTPGTPVCRALFDPEVDAARPANDVLSATPNAEELPASSPNRSHSLMSLGSGNIAAGLGLSEAHPLMNRMSNSGLNISDSEASTPSITNVSSPATTASPSSPPEYSTLMPAVNDMSNVPPDSALMGSNSYDALLSSLSFYHSMTSLPGIPATELRRAHSESELQELLSSPPPSSSESFTAFKDSPPSSNSGGSRSTTPTPTKARRSRSPGAMTPPPTSAGLLETESGVSTRVHC